MAQELSDFADVARRIAASDAILIVGAAGLSISPTLPNNPYHSAADFSRHYPRAVEFGYHTAYEAMGLGADQDVPLSIRAAYTARHFLNMAKNFPPTEGYFDLLRICQHVFPDPDDLRARVFVWTSNVDLCFARSGFPESNVYPVQGDCSRFQCGTCQHIWPVLDDMRRIDANAAANNFELKDMSLLLTCPKCGTKADRPGKLFPNLRGGDWFQPAPQLPYQRRLIRWMQRLLGAAATLRSSAGNSGGGDAQALLSVSVLEVGVGPNTPVVTAIPSCLFAKALASIGGGALVTHIRINPDIHCSRYLPVMRNVHPNLFSVHYAKPWNEVLPALRVAVGASPPREHATLPSSGSDLSVQQLAEGDEWEGADAHRCSVALDARSSRDFQKCLEILRSLA